MNIYARSLALVALALFTTGVANAASFEARYSDDGLGTKQLIRITEESVDAEKMISETSFPRYVVEHDQPSLDKIVVLRAVSMKVLNEELNLRGVDSLEPLSATEALVEAADEVVTLVDSGPAANRIDVVFMGDGYTLSERGKFFSDMQRMIDDMFRDETFKSYLPLFNVHVVFRASNESGIGKNNRSKDTAYGLYRDGNTLRAIYASNSRAAQSSCNKAPGCDYPVIIANDPHYGGLGGQFAISTSSVTSGTKVLRHELGHNFGRVGEEYDGGGYFGANHSGSVNRLSWNHWATEKTVVAEPSKSRFVKWPWHNLNRGNYTASFSSNGDYDHATMRFSASGMGSDDSLSIEVDGDPLDYLGPQTEDRMFHNYDFAGGFTSGSHKIIFKELISDNNNWVSSINIQEFKAGYHFEDTFVGAFPMYSKSGNVDGYRSNHEKCLMRNMNSKHFCSVCQENNWMQFFGKIDLIDGIESQKDATATSVTLKTLEIGQLYSSSTDGSVLEVKWFKNGSEVSSLADLVEWTMPTRDAQGSWKVEVQFKSPEIRKNFSRFADSATISL
jgi:hypothetical protein